jgi:hypothetical protein
MAIQNIISKEYLNLVHKNGQSYEITPFLWFLLMFTSIFGYGPGFENLEFRIRQKFRILADPDPAPAPQHWTAQNTPFRHSPTKHEKPRVHCVRTLKKIV